MRTYFAATSHSKSVRSVYRHTLPTRTFWPSSLSNALQRLCKSKEKNTRDKLLQVRYTSPPFERVAPQLIVVRKRFATISKKSSTALDRVRLYAVHAPKRQRCRPAGGRNKLSDALRSSIGLLLIMKTFDDHPNDGINQATSASTSM